MTRRSGSRPPPRRFIPAPLPQPAAPRGAAGGGTQRRGGGTARAQCEKEAGIPAFLLGKWGGPVC